MANIRLVNLPDIITVDTNTLQRKTEFHITLMAGKFLAPMLQPQRAEQTLQLMKDALNNFATTHDLTQFTLSNEYYLVKHEERTSIVVMVDMPQLAIFFDHLRETCHYAFPTQPAHITLYTLHSTRQRHMVDFTRRTAPKRPKNHTRSSH